MRLPREGLAGASLNLVICVGCPCCEVTEHEDASVEEACNEHLEEVLEGNLLNQIKSVLSKDSMEDVVAVVCV